MAGDADDERTVAERGARAPPVDDEATQVDRAPPAHVPPAAPAVDDEATRLAPRQASTSGPRRPLVRSAAQSLRRFTGEMRAVAVGQSGTPGERRKVLLLLVLVGVALLVGAAQVVISLTTDHPEVARPLREGEPAEEEPGTVRRLFDW